MRRFVFALCLIVSGLFAITPLAARSQKLGSHPTNGLEQLGLLRPDDYRGAVQGQ